MMSESIQTSSMDQRVVAGSVYLYDEDAHVRTMSCPAGVFEDVATWIHKTETFTRHSKMHRCWRFEEMA